ncbi:BRCT domain-containing protein [Xylaria sp. CBS 124048]|nr:BRCT domain-containing protein [Xylaria sp. CBS 124048]
MHSTKISGLAVDTEYTFHLVLRTSAGTMTSGQVVVRTHKMTDLSGITITAGILPPQTRDNLTAAVERIGAKVVDSVRIDTTHFVTTEGRGAAWEKAVEMNIPVVRPEWVAACEESGRILGVTKFYLDALRPGPPIQSPTTTTPAAPPTPPQKEKDLPAAPSPAQGSREGGATEEKGEKERRDGEDKKTENNGVDDNAKATGEQEAISEDKEEQKFAIRPSAEAKVSDSNSADEEKQAGASPGDGASFQDVAL